MANTCTAPRAFRNLHSKEDANFLRGSAYVFALPLRPSCAKKGSVTGSTFSLRRALSGFSSSQILAPLFILLLGRAAPADWLAYRGPTQNGISTEKGWSAEFPETGPKELWKAELGTGISSVTVSAGRVYSMGNKDDTESVYCLDVKTGKEIWRQQFPVMLEAVMFEGGPRSTPTINDNHVYILSQDGSLWCLDAEKGTRIWSHDLQKDFGGKRPQWGYSGSPLVTGDLVICDAGGEGASTVAMDKTTGKVVWKSGSDRPGYATPIVTTIGGEETVILFKAEKVIGCKVSDGTELWQTPWKTLYDVNAATPLLIGDDRIFISSGYNTGCMMLQIKKGAAEVLWKNKNLRSQLNSPVLVNGAIFGIDGNAGGGNLVCIDPTTGDLKWTEKSVKGGSLISSAGKLFILTEKGELITCDASPNGFHAISRAKVLENRCWVQPVLDSSRLLVKNNAGELKCLDLSGK